MRAELSDLSTEKSKKVIKAEEKQAQRDTQVYREESEAGKW